MEKLEEAKKLILESCEDYDFDEMNDFLSDLKSNIDSKHKVVLYDHCIDSLREAYKHLLEAKELIHEANSTCSGIGDEAMGYDDIFISDDTSMIYSNFSNFFNKELFYCVDENLVELIKY